MKKEYIFDNNVYDRNILREISGYYDYNTCNRYVYEISEKASIEELRKVEIFGDGIKAKIFVWYLNLKYIF